MSDYDVIDKFREFALEQGIELPEDIIADGKLHRFKIEGRAKDNLDGRYGLHLDGRPAGFVQDYRFSNTTTKWKYTDPNYKKEPITPEKIKADAERDAERKAKAEEKRKAELELQTAAAMRARQEWNRTKASEYNPYAERKGIKLHNARISQYKGENQLIVPFQNKNGNLVSLQRIKSDGTKMLFKEAQKSGAFSILNRQAEPQVIAIAEGFATTASIIEDRYSVTNDVMGVMAVDAGNLKAVAEIMRELHPKAEIVIFGDIGDQEDKGEKSAKQAAEAVSGYVVLPPIQKGDFNDYLTGKAGDITLSLEQLINQSMGKTMENEDLKLPKKDVATDFEQLALIPKETANGYISGFSEYHKPVNSIENTAVIAQEITHSTFGDNYDFHIPEPDYSNMPQDEDIDYEAHYTEQQRFISRIEQDESMLNQQAKFYYQVEDTGFHSLQAIDAQESAIKSDSEIINYIDDNQVVAAIFMKNGNEYINKKPEPNAPDSLSQAQKEDDFSHAVSIETRAEHNLTLDRKNKSYPELDVKLVAVDSKEFSLIKGDEYKAQALQSMAMNATVSKYYENALPTDIKKIVDSEKLAGLERVKLMAGEKVAQTMAKVNAANTFPESTDTFKPSIDITKTSEPEQKTQVDKSIPKDVADKYLQVGDKFYFKKNKDVVIFEDKGAKLETKLNSPSVASDLVRIAAKRGWKEIKITGTPEFKSEIWMEAESRGIATTGYKPTDIDRAMLKERLAKNTTNIIEEVKVQEKPNIRQILEESADKKMAEQHIKANPKLKETIEYLSALKKQLEKSGASEQQMKVYMATTKDGLAQMIDAGKYLKYQKVLAQPQAQKEKVVTKSKSKDHEMEIG